ncbi:diphosphomevalonate decarboxylase [Clostridiales bacterium COT073_COT-073]|nr:diphosphomevalonate decarboxylase [Clostridiales bacterium COT073_COT-073]
MDLSFECQIKKYARANANIALIKYWGKKDETLKIPFNSSLSMTLDSLYTDTGMAFHTGNEDVFYLNGERQTAEETHKVSRFLDLFRHKKGMKDRLFISSYNNFPTAAGLASSASGYAALAAAANDLLQTDLTDRELSVMTRKGSGSACRSLFGGFVVWHGGDSDENSYAEPFAAADEYAMLIVLIDQTRKKYPSTAGMKQVVETSIFYPAWVEQAEKDFSAIKQAITAGDFGQIGQIAEANCLRMHATTWGAAVPFTYFQPETLAVMAKVRAMRRQGLAVYFTIDAGPNVKLFCRKAELPQILKEMQSQYPAGQLLTAFAGEAYKIKECECFGRC